MVTVTGMGLLTDILEKVRPLVPDTAAAWAARQYLNQRYQQLGQMTTLQIDANKKTATFELELKGETQPLRVTVERYELSTSGDKTLLEIKEVTTSREWINLIAPELLKGRKFEVPAVMRALL